MKETTIYSIGHGNKKIENFIAELKSFKIQFLLDIRSKPYSKWNPQFNQAALDLELKNYGITYVFVGDTLGGLPEDRSCYDNDGKVVYDLIKEKEFFKQGLERLTTANAKKINLAIMCSESKPDECHRSKLIGQELLNKKISLKHIISSKRIKSQETVMNELTKGKGTVDLFGNEMDFTSRKSY
ncbi:DUF488 domain-containing protein [Leeuwenhoekiella nanhaiensis]|uniref:DUF488 domain-containing protein n=1 Tax=Leeuwenhoekiella nanhaiensis TaxID=1655491 RepID=A0A2G1VRI8_9FLAO|nr:DUF488 domain-containing protein [Leeuwenhoekiella nanhaiensis]PHQ29392.1 hypothetical protein CJ305_10655 [Leeuwenhoekiella nanhaiensis]